MRKIKVMLYPNNHEEEKESEISSNLDEEANDEEEDAYKEEVIEDLEVDFMEYDKGV